MVMLPEGAAATLVGGVTVVVVVMTVAADKCRVSTIVSTHVCQVPKLAFSRWWLSLERREREILFRSL